MSISAEGSAFPVQLENSGGGGSVRIARMNPTPVKGDNLIASVTFKAKNAGTATVSFASGTAVVKSSDNKELITTKNVGSYTIKSANPPPPDDEDPPKSPRESCGASAIA